MTQELMAEMLDLLKEAKRDNAGHAKFFGRPPTTKYDEAITKAEALLSAQERYGNV